MLQRMAAIPSTSSSVSCVADYDSDTEKQEDVKKKEVCVATRSAQVSYGSRHRKAEEERTSRGKPVDAEVR